MFAIRAVDLHSEETVWLNEDGVNRVRLFLAPSCSSLSEGGSTRDTGGTIAQSPVGRQNTRAFIMAHFNTGRVNVRFAKGRGQLDRR